MKMLIFLLCILAGSIEVSIAETYKEKISFLGRCWNKSSLSEEALNSAVTLQFEMTEEGFPKNESIKLIKASGESTNAIQIAFQAARRAILVCGSKGMDLPPEKYEEWKIITIIFDPKCKKIEVSPGIFEGCDH